MPSAGIGAGQSSAAGGAPSETAGAAAPVGAPCLPSEESQANFSGFALEEVSLDTESPWCDSGICVVNHFQGRVSCPYGQTDLDLMSGPQCFLRGSNAGVKKAVDPQRIARRASDTVICSCRCDGPGDGPFCTCPSGTQCVALIQDLGLPSSADVAGSYCVTQGTTYDPTGVVAPNVCDRQAMNCGDARPYP
jgi:hypothetical protein